MQVACYVWRKDTKFLYIAHPERPFFARANPLMDKSNFPVHKMALEARPYIKKDEAKVMEPKKASLPHFLVALDHIII